jgi:hypothetical protein
MKLISQLGGYHPLPFIKAGLHTGTDDHEILHGELQGKEDDYGQY